MRGCWKGCANLHPPRGLRFLSGEEQAAGSFQVSLESWPFAKCVWSQLLGNIPGYLREKKKKTLAYLVTSTKKGSRDTQKKKKIKLNTRILSQAIRVVVSLSL